MRQFATETWIDYARGLAPAEQAGVIQEHLDRNCAPCRAAFQVWRKVAEALLNERSYEPPEHAVRIIRAAFQPQAGLPGIPNKAAVARLIFDSFRQPLAEGVEW